MLELLGKYLNMDCIIYLIVGSRVDGIIKEISENGVVLEHLDGTTGVINLEYIVRVREFPKNKDGKRKMVIEFWKLKAVLLQEWL